MPKSHKRRLTRVWESSLNTKIVILFFYVLFVLFNCTGISDYADGEDFGGYEKKEKRFDESSTKNKCEFGDYVVFTDKDCEELKADIEVVETQTLTNQQNFLATVDILFILDTSFSTYFYRKKAFHERFNRFISIIEPLNWRLMVTDTSYDVEEDSLFSAFTSKARNGKVMPIEDQYGVTDSHYLDDIVLYYPELFLYTITTAPDRYKRNPFGQAQEDLTCSYPPYCQNTGNRRPLSALKSSFLVNKNLIREEANYLAVVIVSNGDEATEEEQDLPVVRADAVVKEFDRVYEEQQNKKLLVFNLIILPNDEICKKTNEDEASFFSNVTYGTLLSELPTKTGGGNFSICLEDYSIVADTLVHLVSDQTVFTDE